MLKLQPQSIINSLYTNGTKIVRNHDKEGRGNLTVSHMEVPIALSCPKVQSHLLTSLHPMWLSNIVSHINKDKGLSSTWQAQLVIQSDQWWFLQFLDQTVYRLRFLEWLHSTRSYFSNVLQQKYPTATTKPVTLLDPVTRRMTPIP